MFKTFRIVPETQVVPLLTDVTDLQSEGDVFHTPEKRQKVHQAPGT